MLKNYLGYRLIFVYVPNKQSGLTFIYGDFMIENSSAILPETAALPPQIC